MIELAANTYEHRLLEPFWAYRPKDEEDQRIYDLLFRVCRAWINERGDESKRETISGISLTDEERQLVGKCDLMKHPNLEVRTRFQDVIIRFAKGKERLKLMRQASDGYLELCRETGTYLYFVRAIEIRQAKVLYDEAFMKALRDVVLAVSIYPVWLSGALNKIKANIEGGIGNKYIQDILSAYKAALPKKDVHWVDSFWNMMTEIGATEDAEGHFQRALNWEAYADQMEANKKENVFNVNYHTVLQDSFKEIYKVKDIHPEDYKRILNKYNKARKDFVEAMSLFGVKTKFEIPKALINRIHKQMANLNLESVYQAIICYLSVPFYTAWKDLIDNQVTKSIKKSDILEQSFPDSMYLNNEGNVTGISNYDQDQRLLVHKYVRAALLYHILCLHERIGEHILDYSEVTFYKLLKDCKPSFIEEDRVQLWAKAYRYYFDSDVVISGHLLMPQFENALHNLLEEIVGDVTKLNEDVQKEPSLKKILDLLKPYCNSTLCDELEMFFVNGNDVNYRNELLHGLMGSMDMIRYGHYMFYLANLLYFRGKEFLTLGVVKAGS